MCIRDRQNKNQKADLKRTVNGLNTRYLENDISINESKTLPPTQQFRLPIKSRK